jgi:multiple sugar transport system ATP-binding protein
MTMATRIVVMKDGLIQQVDTPQNLYDLPSNIFVAGFIGTPQMNFINATLDQIGDDLYIKFEGNKLRLPPEKALNPSIKDYIGKEVIAGVRPEAIVESPAQIAALPECSFEAYVDVTELMGAEIYLYLIANRVVVDEALMAKKNVVVDKSGEVKLTARVSPRCTARGTDTITVAIDTERVHIFDKDTEKCICH